jgi:hypothetical protein
VISPSLTSEAEPKSHTFRVALFSVTCSLAWCHLERLQATHENVIRLDIGMNDVGLPQERESQEHLMSISSDSPHIQSNVFSESLDDVSEIHTARQLGHTSASAGLT